MGSPLARIDDQYEIVAKLKEGGMGEIYKVRHRLLEEIRVVKVLHSRLEGDSEVNERFAREARAAIQLRHPNIVQIFDFTLDESGTGLIVMEFIRGTDLKQLIAREERPSVALAIEIARQGLRALGYLHRNGFVHRDVSPDNLMLSQDVEGRPLVKVIDLGIAKRRGIDPQLTASGMFLGKFRYSSPEHFGVHGPDGIEARSDLYTFGLVLYELLTGQSPIKGDSTSQLIAGHLFQPPRDFTETDPRERVPDELRKIVLRTLAKDPDDRFADAEELIAELDHLQARFPLGPEVLEESRRFAETPARRRKATAAPPAATAVTEPATPPRDPQPVESGAGSRIRALLEHAEGQMRAGQVQLARAQLLAILEIEGEHPEARRLLAEIDDGADERAVALDHLVEEVDTLLQSGRLIEADRKLFQAEEEHGTTTELSTMRARLDRLYQKSVEEEVRELVAGAEAASRDGEPTRALEILNKARATAPPLSPLSREVEAALGSLEQCREEQRRRATIDDAERRLLTLIQRRELVAARDVLTSTAAEVGEDPALGPLRQLVSKTVEERVRELVKDAGVAFESESFEAAGESLAEALELDPENSWIRARLEKTRSRQAEQEETARRETERADELTRISSLIDGRDLEAATRRLHAAVGRLGSDEAFNQLGERLAALRREVDARRYLEEARQAREAGDILKARLLVAKVLELAPGDADAATLGQTLDREHRAAELQLSTLKTRPLSPALAKAFTEIEDLRARGDSLGAWRLLQGAIEELGENDTFNRLRRVIADEILSERDGPEI